jgi:hypothetical protein
MSSPGSRTAETGAWLSDECPSRLPLTLFGSESGRTCLTEFFRQSRRTGSVTTVCSRHLRKREVYASV